MRGPGFRLVGAVLAFISIALGLVSAFSHIIGLQQCGSLDVRLSISGCVRSFEGTSPAYSPSRTLLATVSTSGTSVELWRIVDGTLLQTFETGPAYTNAFSPDETFLAVGVYQATQLWRVADGTLRDTLPGQATWVKGLAFSPDGTLLATGGTDDSYVRVWRVGDGSLLHSLDGHRPGTAQVRFSPDGTSLAAILGDGSALACALLTDTPLRLVACATARLRQNALHPRHPQHAEYRRTRIPLVVRNTKTHLTRSDFSGAGPLNR